MPVSITTNANLAKHCSSLMKETVAFSVHLAPLNAPQFKKVVLAATECLKRVVVQRLSRFLRRPDLKYLAVTSDLRIGRVVGAQGRNRPAGAPAVRVRYRHEDFQSDFDFYNLIKSITYDAFPTRLCQ